MLTGTCLGFLADAGCGLIYADVSCDGSRVVFVHFRDIEPKQDGRQDLKTGDEVLFHADKTHGELFYRPCAAVGRDNGFVQVGVESTRLVFKTTSELDGFVANDNQVLVIIGDIPADWEPKNIFSGQKDALFYQCTWHGKTQLHGFKVQGDLVFLGCSFKESFSLRESCIAGSVHMEGCDFSGTGGASFRGLQAKALYLDFGVIGPKDMMWLNEMYIQHDVVIGGEFEGSIQVMRMQDSRVTSQTHQDNKTNDRACFQRLCIGKEFYKSQNVNRTVLQGALDIHGLSHGEQIYIEHAKLAEVTCCNMGGHVVFQCEHSKILGNVLLRGQDKAAHIQQVSLFDSYIEGHCNIRDMQIQGCLDMDDATVERVIRLSKVSFAVGGGLRLARLCANRLVMDDFTALYGVSQAKQWWKNPAFTMLQREASVKDLHAGPPVELIQEYVLLKNLLSQEGQLQLEDEAFYNMRKLNHWYQDWKMLLLNGIFGWGVRLQNILFSVLFVIASFTVVYDAIFPDISGLAALQLSIQSMFLAFFGDMQPKVLAGSGLSWLVLLESVMGVVFVTVFVGAYVRKLLR